MSASDRERLTAGLRVTLGRDPTLGECHFHTETTDEGGVVGTVYLNLPGLSPPLAGEFTGPPCARRGEAINAAARTGISALEERGFRLDAVRGVVRNSPVVVPEICECDRYLDPLIACAIHDVRTRWNTVAEGLNEDFWRDLLAEARPRLHDAFHRVVVAAARRVAATDLPVTTTSNHVLP